MENLKAWFNKLYYIGAVELGGVTRLGYSKEEDEMHNAVVNIAKQLGFKSKADGVGNTYIYLKDYNEDYILIGSHLDSVPNGGRYDGVAGVLGGLLILKWIKENKMDIPIKLGIFRSEESSAFGVSLIGSSLASGAMDENGLKSIKDKEGKSLYEVLTSMGYLEKEYGLKSIKLYLEIHIEQGRVLWGQNIDLGIVTVIAAPERYRLKIIGRQDHSGATPMNMRKDALCAAAEIILALEKHGQDEAFNSTVATVGICDNSPNAMNVVPSAVELGIDIRGINEGSINRVVQGLKDSIEKIIKKRELDYKLTHISSEKPVLLDEDIIKGLEQTAKNMGINHIKMASGAGHDAVVFAPSTKTGMIFVPNEEGISHNPEEKMEIEDLYRACRVVYEYLVDLV